MKEIINFAFYTFFGMIIFCALTILLDTCVRADAIELQELKITYRQFFPGGVDPLITQNGLRNNLDKELMLHMNMDVVTHCYWNNRIHSRTDTNNSGGGQFRLIGWEFTAGCWLFDNLAIDYGHHSQHIADYTSPVFDHFPVEDSVGLTIYIYRAKPSGKGIF